MSLEENTAEHLITSAQFVKGIIGTDPILTDGLPQIAFVGRSNVGKSSVINVLTNKKGLAKSSSTPGKTSEINFFRINDELYFVDLPGYGYAKVKPQLAEKFRKRIIWYLSDSGALPEYVVLILDTRRGLTDKDRDLLDIIREEKHPLVVVANKIDKLSQKEKHALLSEIENEIQALSFSKECIVPFSAMKGKGKTELFTKLFG